MQKNYLSVKIVLMAALNVLFFAGYIHGQPPALARKGVMLFADSTGSGKFISKDPHVIYFNNRYFMYYSSPQANGAGWRIGIAQSDNMVEWKAIGCIKPSQECDMNGLCAPCAKVVNGKVHLFYQSYGNREKDAICHAVSTDGINFDKDPSNPVFSPSGAWNCGRAIDAEVVFFKNRYYLYYATREPDFKRQMLGVAVANADTDFGRGQWTDISTDRTILKPDLTWEGECIEAPSITVQNGRLYMFYAGGYNNYPQQTGVAVSDDGVSWKRLSNKPFLPNGKQGEWNSSESGHPHLFEAPNGRTYLFYQGNSDGGKTWYISNTEVYWKDGVPSINTYNSIKPGQVWLDTDGKRIQAHGGSIFYDAAEKTFYWYGENKEKTVPGSGIWHWGVRAYSSKDLYNWKDEGVILPPEEKDRNSPLYFAQGMDRPHILYNDRTKKYVMWVKIIDRIRTRDEPYYEQYMTIATADRFLGPYKTVKTIHPLGMNSGDFDLVMNGNDHKAYIYFERVHTELVCADLTDDFTDVTGHYSCHFPRRQPPFVREAPAFFSRKGRLYLITSGTTDYFPNRSEVASAELFHGPWTVLGDPHVGDPSGTSFHSQVTSVFKHPHKKDLYIALADRWLTDLNDSMPDMEAVFDAMFSPDKKSIMTGKEYEALSMRNTSLADYVWLPIRFTADGRPYIEWLDEWRIEDFE